MTMTQTRPGNPDDIHPLKTLAFLGVLFGAGAAGWAIAIGIGWLVWAYTLVMVSIIASLAVVAGCAYLAVKGNTRARVLAAVIVGALVWFVIWTATL